MQGMRLRRNSVVMLRLVWLLLAVAPAAVASAQTVVQDFEQSLRYDACYAGANVSLESGSTPLQGRQQLLTGPLSKNKEASYLTPFLSLTAGGGVRFTHRNETKGGKGNPSLRVELLGTDGAPAAIIYTYTHGASTQAVA